MRRGRSTALRGLLAAGAAAGLTVAIVGGSPASAQQGAPAAAPVATVSMRFDTARGPHFTGSRQVAAGQILRIRNLSDPKMIGPHTFTLVAANLLPKNPRQCGNICRTAGTAHDRTQLVKAGQTGWDKRFSNRIRLGDSWFSKTKDEEVEQVVRAQAGTLLRYLCIIHPEMQGKIKVVG